MTARTGCSTQAIHAGALHPRAKGSMATPIFQYSTHESAWEDYHDIGYMRLSNSPNHNVLGERLAALECSKAALVTANGVVAISATWQSLVRPTTRAIYVETLTNPLIQVVDLEAVVGFAREHGLVSIIDDTFASPVNFPPAVPASSRPPRPILPNSLRGS